MEAVSTCQPKINILGVTAAYYVCLLNFYKYFDASFVHKKTVFLLASVCINVSD